MDVSWEDRATIKRFFSRLPYSYTFFVSLSPSGEESLCYRIECQALPSGAWVEAFVIKTADGYFGCSSILGLEDAFRSALAHDVAGVSGYITVDQVLSVFPFRDVTNR